MYLLGNPITDMTSVGFDRIDHPQYYVLVPKTENDQFRPTYFFDPNTFRLKEQRFIVPGSSQSLSIKYSKFKKWKAKHFLKKLKFLYLMGLT